MATGPYLQNLAAARTVEWGKVYNWDMFIPSAPSPFDQWFPASELDHVLANVSSHEFHIGSQGFKVPLASAPRDIRLTFYDDENASLEDWLDAWFNTVLVDQASGAVATISTATRDLHFAQMNNQRQVIKEVILWVYPDGSFNSIRSSQSEAMTHVCNFVIVAKQVNYLQGTPENTGANDGPTQNITSDSTSSDDSGGNIGVLNKNYFAAPSSSAYS